MFKSIFYDPSNIAIFVVFSNFYVFTLFDAYNVNFKYEHNRQPSLYFHTLSISI